MLLEPNPGLVLWTILTFLLLLWLLRKVAWKPLLEALHKREEHVRESMERAEQAKIDAERILEENKKQLAGAEAESKQILAEGRALAEKLKNEMLEQTNQQSRKMIDRAREEIERDKEAALAQLRSEVAQLAIKAAEKLLDENLDEAKQRKIIDTYLKELPKN